jgi:predicted nucleic acid-binding Zn ribbon protein
VVGDVLARLGQSHVIQEAAVLAAWRDVAGEAIATRALPERLRRGVLYVRVATSAWMNELCYVRGELAERLNERVGASAVSEVRFEVGDISDKEGERK